MKKLLPITAALFALALLLAPSVAPIRERIVGGGDERGLELSANIEDALDSLAPDAVYAAEFAEVMEPIRVVASVGPEVDWTSRNPAAYRAQRVELVSDILDVSEAPFRVGDLVELELFDGSIARAEVEVAQYWGRHEQTFTARARFDSDPSGFMVLSSVGGVLRLLMQDSLGGDVYQLRYSPELSAHVLLHVDEDSSEVYACANDHSHDVLCEDASAGGGVPLSVFVSSESETTNTILDIMVAYTPAALVIEGSLANMEANISQAIALSNMVHDNSDTQVELNLVHSVELDYTESGSGSTILQRLSDDGDGVMDEVHGLREYYGADFVTLFLDSDSLGSRRTFGGLAWRPDTYDRPDRAFSLVRINQSDTTSYTTVHEISHNMGNGHSKTQASQSYPGDGVAPYAAGWQWVDATSSASIGFCSVMTYENFNSSGSDEYSRVPHLSNPNISYLGSATGDPNDGDAARSIREGRLIFAAFSEPFAYETVDAFPYSFGFETDDSVWTQSPNEEHDWTVDQVGGTPSDDTGPEIGASEGARYAYVEASGFYGESAALVARFDFSALSNVQLVFDYHMLDEVGGYMGDLSVDVSLDDEATWIPVNVISDNQGDYWRRSLVDLSAYSGQVVLLRFMGQIGNWYPSDIAIDRILVGDALIADSPDSYMDWLALSYPSLVDPTQSGNSDGDAFSNFEEYAFGLSPDLFDSTAQLLGADFDMNTEQLTLRFKRGREQLRYLVESTGDLSDWLSPSIVWDSLTANNLVPEGEMQFVPVDMSTSRQFFRVKVEE